MARQARNDVTIERPARKIARFDEPAEPQPAVQPEESAPTESAPEAEKEDE